MKDKSAARVIIANELVLIGIGLGALYWILESVVEVFVFHHEGGFFYYLFPPDFHVIWHRFLIVSMLIILGAYAQLTIAKRKWAEEAISKSEKLYRGLVETMHEFVAEIQLEGVFQFVNLPFSNATGYTIEEFIGTNFFSYLHPDDVAPTLEHCRFLQESQQPIRNCEYRFRKKDGDYLNLLTNGDPIYDAEGNMKGVLQVSFDITERKKAEKEIKDLAKFPAENPNPVLRIAKDGKVLYANEACKSQLSEWNCKIGQYVSDDLHKLVVDAPKSDSSKEIYVKHSGRTFSISVTPITDAGYANIYGRDITERKKIEDVLNKKIEELEKWYNLTVGRELRMVELKEKIKELEQEIERLRGPR